MTFARQPLPAFAMDPASIAPGLHSAGAALAQPGRPGIGAFA
jgi:hypothetical protein